MTQLGLTLHWVILREGYGHALKWLSMRSLSHSLHLCTKDGHFAKAILKLADLREVTLFFLRKMEETTPWLYSLLIIITKILVKCKIFFVHISWPIIILKFVWHAKLREFSGILDSNPIILAPSSIGMSRL